MPEQDFRLRADAAAHFEHPMPSAERKAIMDHGLEEPGLPV